MSTLLFSNLQIQTKDTNTTQEPLSNYKIYKEKVGPWIKEVGSDLIILILVIFLLNLIWRMFKRLSGIFDTFDSWLASIRERKDRSIVLTRTQLEYVDKYEQRLEAERKVNELLHNRLVTFQKMRADALKALDKDLLSNLSKLDEIKLTDEIKKNRKKNILDTYNSLNKNINKEFFELDEKEFSTFFDQINQKVELESPQQTDK